MEQSKPSVGVRVTRTSEAIRPLPPPQDKPAEKKIKHLG